MPIRRIPSTTTLLCTFALTFALLAVAGCNDRDGLGGDPGAGGSTARGGAGGHASGGSGGAGGYAGYGGWGGDIGGAGGYAGYGGTGGWGGWGGDIGGAGGGGGYAGTSGAGGGTGGQGGCACPPPPPVVPMPCPDGTYPQLICQRFDAGYCGWVLTQCPNVCPPVACDVYCPYGNQVDSRGCQICACNPPPANCSVHPDPMSCQTDMRCQWLAPGCGDPALPAQGCYARSDVGCQGDAACTGGRTCLKRIVDPCPLPCNTCGACAACGQVITICL
jgi:Antistasin family